MLLEGVEQGAHREPLRPHVVGESPPLLNNQLVRPCGPATLATSQHRLHCFCQLPSRIFFDISSNLT